MARVTVEDAVKQVGNRFDLVLTAARRARQISVNGCDPLVELENDKKQLDSSLAQEEKKRKSLLELYKKIRPGDVVAIDDLELHVVAEEM